MAVSICRMFGVSENEVLIDIEELRKASESIVSFYKMVNMEPRGVTINFTAQDEAVLETNRLGCILPFNSVNVGSHTFGCLIGLVGLPNYLGEGRHKLMPDRVMVESMMVKTDGDFEDQLLIEDKVSDLIKKVAEDGTLAVVLSTPS